jgi:hypothetical protein
MDMTVFWLFELLILLCKSAFWGWGSWAFKAPREKNQTSFTSFASSRGRSCAGTWSLGEVHGRRWGVAEGYLFVAFYFCLDCFFATLQCVHDGDGIRFWNMIHAFYQILIEIWLLKWLKWSVQVLLLRRVWLSIEVVRIVVLLVIVVNSYSLHLIACLQFEHSCLGYRAKRRRSRQSGHHLSAKDRCDIALVLTKIHAQSLLERALDPYYMHCTLFRREMASFHLLGRRIFSIWRILSLLRNHLRRDSWWHWWGVLVGDWRMASWMLNWARPLGHENSEVHLTDHRLLLMVFTNGKRIAPVLSRGGCQGQRSSRRTHCPRVTPWNCKGFRRAISWNCWISYHRQDTVVHLKMERLGCRSPDQTRSK